MVTRKWLRSALTAPSLYTVAGAVIAYFGLNAYSGNRGLRAKQELEEQIAQLNDELAGLRAERARWERRVLLLRPGSMILTCWMNVPGRCSITPYPVIRRCVTQPLPKP